VTQFEIDSDELADKLKKEVKVMFPDDKEWKIADFHGDSSVLANCDKLSKEFFSIFDACLVQKPPRKDIIKLYMDTQHTLM
jgi:hypothetical protein